MYKIENVYSFFILHGKNVCGDTHATCFKTQPAACLALPSLFPAQLFALAFTCSYVIQSWSHLTSHTRTHTQIGSAPITWMAHFDSKTKGEEISCLYCIVTAFVKMLLSTNYAQSVEYWRGNYLDTNELMSLNSLPSTTMLRFLTFLMTVLSSYKCHITFTSTLHSHLNEYQS